jgi:hypothetical protein
VADHGAAFMGTSLLYLKGGTKDHFMGFLAQSHPELVKGYQRLYPGTHASRAYASAVHGVIDVLKQRHGVHARAKRVDVPEPSEDADEDTPAAQGNLW